MIVYRYIAKTIALPTLAVTTVALALFSTTRFIGILERAVSNGIGSEVFLILLLNFPSYITEILPIGLYLGVILGIGKLYVDQEITALISSGVTSNTLIKGILLPASVVTILLWVLYLWVSPWSLNKANERWRELTAQSAFDLVETGHFNKLNADGLVLYAGSQANNQLNGVFFADADKQQFMWAEFASLNHIDNTNSRYFSMNQVTQIGLPGSSETTNSTFETYSILVARPEAVSKPNQAHLDSSIELLQKGTRWHKTELLYRVLMPPIAIVLAILGFAFARTKPRQGQFRMILPAILTYSVYSIMISASVRPVYRSQAPYFTAIWWVHVLFLGLATLIIAWPHLHFRAKSTT